LLKLLQPLRAAATTGLQLNGTSSEKFERSVEELQSTFEHIESEVEALVEVIAGHDDFCALLASCGTAVACSFYEGWLALQESS
jgi:hypothetical protein